MERPPQQSPVELRVGGETYRVKATATEATLLRLADAVDAKLKAYQGARAGTPQALLLAAMSLANDLEEERARRVAAEERAKQMLRTVVARLDALLGDGASLGGAHDLGASLASLEVLHESLGNGVVHESPGAPEVERRAPHGGPQVPLTGREAEHAAPALSSASPSAEAEGLQRGDALAEVRRRRLSELRGETERPGRDDA
ncbi:MAG: cell division protein ZapA [Polyangiaceae bacterium]|nr:cell division protein ZapA [Polyangiaceae bacterium]MCW5790073.1 cell division protein ZapA [Polyangiaceae bacterium]